ncbi:MAG: preprotein translocase subunit SecE [Candidatus Yanofskybacteria bacterium RIFCSPHIGHO2_02_FULL_44_12b]|uniref:Protein translocase subunit SecE n=1 Tax=Candidatus Yanofskybacteria bacterium RIFCSPLOWO2_01_FULL_44_22 TaxID=1802697 RepID=A0A1F8GLV8_9BACT|nr:MAG: preprotein translocase subunit SecE [Candidatus Yanofskybacteria bacterium RIFCSPHIGHO2_01_FULL_44_24]OGN15344.1 MAG: preprotein translocase subunit SecE [Candidatus Yanofskybacteria bacterium RIFCSPHIGHO2_02_FULL_44_12b]OGN25970.1 MAG: preprotein translocase subunit SecE [Candidatus Yanofskybacteria bacterium RIFCSPLOWO2_01_FULL_44_22]
MDKVVNFLKDVKTELSKVNWPTRKQTTQYTLIVVGISLFLAVFLGLVDLGLGTLLKELILK